MDPGGEPRVLFQLPMSLREEARGRLAFRKSLMLAVTFCGTLPPTWLQTLGALEKMLERGVSFLWDLRSGLPLFQTF